LRELFAALDFIQTLQAITIPDQNAFAAAAFGRRVQRRKWHLQMRHPMKL
jgi:hypothetical protein